MIKELDVVILTRDLPELGIPAGTSGTVVFDHEVANPEPAFEVELMTDDGKTIDVVTLNASDLRLATAREMDEMRQVAMSR